MDDPGDRTGPKRRRRADGNRSAVDAGERDEDCSDSDSSDSVYESTRLKDLSSSLRVFFDSVIKKELAESEMMRSREALRLQAEKRRVETESELTQMLVQTQMQIASFVAVIDSSRKRKRVGEDESPVSQSSSVQRSSIDAESAKMQPSPIKFTMARVMRRRFRLE